MEEWKPNLFVAGFSKCGTTALCDYLAQHKDIYVTVDKEPSSLVAEYINDIKLHPIIWGVSNLRDVVMPLPFNTYKNYYLRNSSKKIRVDGSTVYTYKTYFASILKEFNHSAKVILCIREQNDRLISMYRFTYPAHKLPFNKWVNNIMPYIDSYIDEFLFYEHVVRYEALFNKNLLVIDQRTLLNNPLYTLEKVFRFLNLKPIEVKPLISNPSYTDPFNYYNNLSYFYIRLRSKVFSIIKKYALHDSIIYKILRSINSRISRKIFYNANRSIEIKRKLMQEIPPVLRKLLDEDYRRTTDFCKAKNILLK